MSRGIFEQSQEVFGREEFSQRAVDLIAAAGTAAVAARGRFTLALTGGRTVQPVYRHLAACADPALRRLLSEQTDYFWGDERLVALEHQDSNFALARRLFLDKLMVPPEHLHPALTDPSDQVGSARIYEQELRDFFGLELSVEGFPIFDMILLGLGPDGHVASLFPGSKALAERTRWVAGSLPTGAAPRVARVTLTLPLLNQARLLLVLAAGTERIKLARRIGAAEPGIGDLPMARLRPSGRMIWLFMGGD